MTALLVVVCLLAGAYILMLSAIYEAPRAEIRTNTFGTFGVWVDNDRACEMVEGRWYWSLAGNWPGCVMALDGEATTPAQIAAELAALRIKPPPFGDV